MSITSSILRNLSNIPGWHTNRKLILFTVDDYGSIRMTSKEAFESLIKAGVNLSSRYNRFETIESNTDLELLFEVLTKFNDRNGNHPVFTPLVCVANPDFEKIKSADFQEYFYEPFTETLKRYSGYDRVHDLWKQGIEKNIFMPQFHGREHLNVKRWMSDLQQGVKSTLLAFEHGVTGIGPQEADDLLKDYQAAFDIDKPDDIEDLKKVLSEGLLLFEDLVSYKASFFTPANSLFNHKLDETLKQYGINLVNAGKKETEPLGDGKFKKSLHYMGQKNQFGQRYIVRNAMFEPSEKANFDWIDRCIKDIEIAFRWKKPAIISSHRVNFSGQMVPGNRGKSLKKLDKLLSVILKKWPDVEFLSTIELEKLIFKKN